MFRRLIVPHGIAVVKSKKTADTPVQDACGQVLSREAGLVCDKRIIATRPPLPNYLKPKSPKPKRTTRNPSQASNAWTGLFAIVFALFMLGVIVNGLANGFKAVFEQPSAKESAKVVEAPPQPEPKQTFEFAPRTQTVPSYSSAPQYEQQQETYEPDYSMPSYSGDRVSVRGHMRRTPSGRMTYVKPHTRSRPHKR